MRQDWNILQFSTISRYVLVPSIRPTSTVGKKTLPAVGIKQTKDFIPALQVRI